jgi:predicted ATP-dependent endonuclease of OLD family
MRIEKLIIRNFKGLQKADLILNKGLSILVGDNEMGKSTVLEAINLVLGGQLYGRSINSEISPFLFNRTAVDTYINNLRNGIPSPPPFILIEAYCANDPSLAKFRGLNNSERVDMPGVYLKIELDEAYEDEYSEYIQNAENMETIPTEYYTVRWFSFANNGVTVRSIPIKSTIIDTHAMRTLSGADRYISKIIDDALSVKQRVELSLAFRHMKHQFIDHGPIAQLNDYLETKKGDITDKKFTVSLDTSARSGWESNLIPYLDDLPFSNAGKGEQASVKMKLAMHSSSDAHIHLIEEPENHLSYSNMHRLIDKISTNLDGKQVVIATHSSFVLNKLGVDNVILFSGDKSLKLNDLRKETFEYFMKLPGHDTLRLILAKKAILVEGPSDELIVQRAFKDKYGKSPLEEGVDVISVKSLAFKRFLDIAKILGTKVCVVTDNDGDIEKLTKKYEGYIEYICYDTDTTRKTLEPQLLKANSLEVLNDVLEKYFIDEDSLLKFMEDNKTDCALKIFSSDRRINYPRYIIDAIEK